MYMARSLSVALSAVSGTTEVSECDASSSCFMVEAAGSDLRRIDFVYHSTLGLRVMKKKGGELCSQQGKLESLNRSGTRHQ